jgi:hypothetical protein
MWLPELEIGRVQGTEKTYYSNLVSKSSYKIAMLQIFYGIWAGSMGIFDMRRKSAQATGIGSRV